MMKRLNIITKSFASSIKQNKKILIWSVLALSLPFLLIITFNLLLWERIYPGIHIAGVNVGGLSPDKASEKVASASTNYSRVTLTSDSNRYEVVLDSIDMQFGFQKSVDRAYLLFRTGNLFYDTKEKLLSLINKKEIGLYLDYDESLLEENLSVIAGQVSTPAVYPSVTKTQGGIVVEKGSVGKDVDTKKLKTKVVQAISLAKVTPVIIEVEEINPVLTEAEALDLKKRAENISDKTLILDFEEQVFEYKDNKLLVLLDAKSAINKRAAEQLISDVATKIEREPQNAVFEFKQGRVQEFLPAKKGVGVEKEKLLDNLVSVLNKLETEEEKYITINIPTQQADPEISTEEVNSLGIEGLLGRGTSRFRGSAASRIHNISLASSKFNGVLVRPGEIFSFNESLGDVSSFTGYKQAYVIKDGKTILGDGGGVCQVSTTFFRAIINSGLPVVERNPHSYRVGYYEQDSKPGIDATIYTPYVDLKFKNDTPGYLLIQTQVDPANHSLAFEIYGASDGRKSLIATPVISSSTPPPEDLYIDDPTLPAGEIKQIEYKAWGAKVSFNYKVTRGSETLFEKTFYSNYQPWQAVFLRGTGPLD